MYEFGFVFNMDVNWKKNHRPIKEKTIIPLLCSIKCIYHDILVRFYNVFVVNRG